VPRYVALLRGINVGGRNRVAMTDLRGLLEGLGYGDVRTHLQSGNAVLSASSRSGTAVGKAVEEAVAAELGLQIRVVVRSAAQLASVIAADPLGEVSTDHSHYLVAFCDKPVPPSVATDLVAADYAPEELAVVGSEVYLWLPHGVQDSRLAKALTDRRLGGTSTMRNWNTVRKLAELAGGQTSA